MQQSDHHVLYMPVRAYVWLLIWCLSFLACSSRHDWLYWKAEQLWRSARYEEAAGLYEKIFTQDPNSEIADDAIYEAANVCYFNLHRMNRAVELYQKLLTTYTTSKHAQEARWRLSQIYEGELGDLRQALRLREGILKTAPGDFSLPNGEATRLEIMLKIADGYFKINEFDKALAYYREVADRYERNHPVDQANLKIGNIYQMHREYKASLDPLAKVVRNTSCPECKRMAQRGLIEAYENLEEFDKAIEVAKSISASADARAFGRWPD